MERLAFSHGIPDCQAFRAGLGFTKGLTKRFTKGLSKRFTKGLTQGFPRGLSTGHTHSHMFRTNQTWSVAPLLIAVTGRQPHETNDKNDFQPGTPTHTHMRRTKQTRFDAPLLIGHGATTA